MFLLARSETSDTFGVPRLGEEERSESFQSRDKTRRERGDHGGWRQPMCDPEGCSTVWGAVEGGGGPHPPPKGGGTPPPPPSLTQTQHLFRQAPSKRANTQS